MAQQQAPEVGTVMDGYRFKGGDPSQQGSWEQVAPVDVSSEYGSGARRLPNGVIERVGPRGGVQRIASANGGAESSPMVGADARARFMINLGPLQAAQANLERMDAEGYNPSSLQNTGASALEAVPFDGGWAARQFGGDDYNAYNQAAKTFEAAIMPIMSGAAVTPSEAQRLIRAALPQPGDSPEVLAQKAEQRRMMINAVAQGIGQPAPYENTTPGLDAQGLPDYQGPVGREASDTPPAISGAAPGAPPAGPAGPAAPGSDPDSPVDISGLSAQDLMALQPGQFIRFPDGRVEQLSGAPRLGADGEQVAPGVYQERRPSEEIRDSAANQRSRPGIAGQIGATDRGFGRRADAFVRGVADTVTFGTADEIAAGLDTIIPATPGSRSGWTDGFGEAYRQNVAQQRGIDTADRTDLPVTRVAGQVTGGFVPGAGVARAAVGGTRLARAGRAVGAGAAIGGAYGFGSGEGNALERIPDAAAGAGIGAALGPIAAPAANALNRGVIQPAARGLQAVNRAVARPVVNALGDAAPTGLREAVAVNPLRSGMNRFAERSPQDVNALNSEAARFRAEEIAPTFADTVNDGGRGTIRALATRQTPARQAAREFADGRAAGLQDRISTQARRTISNDPRQPAQIREEITTARNRRADQEFGAVRGDMISPDRGVLEALRAPAVRPAIEEAATSALNRGDNETAMMLRNLTDDAMDYGADAQITVGMADRIARSLNGRAEAFQRSGNNDAASSYFALAERLRGSARQQAPGYDQALQSYAADSGLAKATELGEQFMTMEADQFAAAVARLTPEEQQIAQAAARRAVERQAGTQGQAPGVAQRLSNGREQAARTEALTGDAAPVQRAMGAELQTLRNAQGINPAQGSPTSMNAQDAMGAAGAARDVMTGNVAGLAGRAMNAIRSRGFNDAEAEAIVNAAIDPQQTERLIGMLAERMSRREARSLARAIRYQLTTGPQSGRQQ